MRRQRRRVRKGPKYCAECLKELGIKESRPYHKVAERKPKAEKATTTKKSTASKTKKGVSKKTESVVEKPKRKYVRKTK